MEDWKHQSAFKEMVDNNSKIGITKRNEAMALFMGKVANPVDKGETWSEGFVFTNDKGEILAADNWRPLQYNTSWDWLMAVVEKICQIKYPDGDSIYPRTFGMVSDKGKIMFRFNRHELYEADTLKEVTFLAVSEFCMQYQNNPI